MAVTQNAFVEKVAYWTMFVLACKLRACVCPGVCTAGQGGPGSGGLLALVRRGQAEGPGCYTGMLAWRKGCTVSGADMSLLAFIPYTFLAFAMPHMLPPSDPTVLTLRECAGMCVCVCVCMCWVIAGMFHEDRKLIAAS